MTRPAGSSAAKAVKVTERMRERGVQATWWHHGTCSSCGRETITNDTNIWCRWCVPDYFKEE